MTGAIDVALTSVSVLYKTNWLESGAVGTLLDLELIVEPRTKLGDCLRVGVSEVVNCGWLILLVVIIVVVVF